MQVATRARAGEQLDRDVGEAITVRMEQQGVGEAARQRLQMAMRQLLKGLLKVLQTV